MYGHKKCNTTHVHIAVKGYVLNKFLCCSREHAFDTLPFTNNDEYHICRSLFLMINNQKTTNINSSNSMSEREKEVQLVNRKKDAIYYAKTHAADPRETRNFLRSRIPIDDMKGIKSVILKIAGEPDTKITLSMCRRKTMEECYHDDVLRRYHKTPFHKLKMKERRSCIKLSPC